MQPEIVADEAVLDLFEYGEMILDLEPYLPIESMGLVYLPTLTVKTGVPKCFVQKGSVVGYVLATCSMVFSAFRGPDLLFSATYGESPTVGSTMKRFKFKFLQIDSWKIFAD